jgi:hypothetical protein
VVPGADAAVGGDDGQFVSPSGRHDEAIRRIPVEITRQVDRVGCS